MLYQFETNFHLINGKKFDTAVGAKMFISVNWHLLTATQVIHYYLHYFGSFMNTPFNSTGETNMGRPGDFLVTSKLSPNPPNQFSNNLT